MRRIPILIILLGVLSLLPAGKSFADPSITVKTKYYEIRGLTARQLKAQMRRRGPKGFWAYTRWYVRWTGNCRVSAEINYTFPRWTNRKQATGWLRQRWDRMTRNLWRHEKGHGRHGINAAHEIHKSRCRGDPMKIIRKWAKQDRIYDRRTGHGRTEGVVFP